LGRSATEKKKQTKYIVPKIYGKIQKTVN
jgi:hypothetical protein